MHRHSISSVVLYLRPRGTFIDIDTSDTKGFQPLILTLRTTDSVLGLLLHALDTSLQSPQLGFLLHVHILLKTVMPCRRRVPLHTRQHTGQPSCLRASGSPRDHVGQQPHRPPQHATRRSLHGSLPADS